MTLLQQITVNKLLEAGFQIIVQTEEIVRMTKGADRRVVMQDGSQKRGHHDAQPKVRKESR